ISLVSQSVLLRGVNDSVAALRDLMRVFLSARVKPYYLHHPDLAPGTAHFRLTIDEGLALVAQLRGDMSGLGQPVYVLDLPGGFGKIVLTDASVTRRADGRYMLRDRKGHTHLYPPDAAA
ncbi:MAG: lysine 2,3-aminomutase, partial [Beijerinckiaceae bacterium]